MDLSDVSLGTPKVLDRCLDLLSDQLLLKKNHVLPRDTSEILATPAKYASHPDIQFFSSVKAKNHFAYHSSKKRNISEKSPSLIVVKGIPEFDPWSLDLLLERIRSYNALNWDIPHFKQSGKHLTELYCSSYGWKCEALSRENTLRNSLVCTGCKGRLVLTFNSLDEQPAYAPFRFDYEDIQSLNIKLKDLYLQQVQDQAHTKLCPWRNFACPLLGVYYLTPHVDSTNSSLISRYLTHLYGLYKNWKSVQKYTRELIAFTSAERTSDLSEFVRISNLWFVNRYFKDTKENLGPHLEKTFPQWAYLLAAMGFKFQTQGFAKVSMPILTCTMCNHKVFLCTKVAFVSGDEDVQNMTLATLTQTAALSTDNAPKELETADEEDVSSGHKPWCLFMSKFDGAPYFNYFHDTITHLEAKIGPQGQYRETTDDFTEVDVTSELTNKKRSIDVTEDLEKFTKLRKLYFADDSEP